MITTWKILEDIEVKKGITELFFYDFLKSKADFELYKSIKFSFYYPDLILVDKSSKLVFDIEIDEPYSLDTKNPIHFDDSDKQRDEYFIENGFIVIRFSENQIVDSTEFCIAVINLVKESVLAFDTSKIYDEMEFSYPCWTYEDAFKMAYNNSRQAILKKLRPC